MFIQANSGEFHIGLVFFSYLLILGFNNVATVMCQKCKTKKVRIRLQMDKVTLKDKAF